MSDVSEIPKMDFDRVLDKDESEIDRNIKIHITHFVNPHCFFFKLDIQLHNLPLYEIEGSLAVHAKNIISKQSNNRYTPKIGEIVGAYVITWNKWIRAQVRTISPERLNYQYILWAIDHGKQVETIDKFLVPLPDAIKNKSIDSVYQGSIRSYGPAENMYVSDQLKYILTPSNEWSQKAIDISEQLIANKSGTYLEMIARNGKYFFGDLHVEHKNGQRINIVECLSQMNLTLHKPNFQNDIVSIKAKYLDKYIRQCEGLDCGTLSWQEMMHVHLAQKRSKKRLANASRSTNRYSNDEFEESEAFYCVDVDSVINHGRTKMNPLKLNPDFKEI